MEMLHACKEKNNLRVVAIEDFRGLNCCIVGIKVTAYSRRFYCIRVISQALVVWDGDGGGSSGHN